MSAGFFPDLQYASHSALDFRPSVLAEAEAKKKAA
jgi:hypothetical protein